MDGYEQKVTEEKEPNKLVILNPTMKEIEKFEKDTIDDEDPDILGKFKKEHEHEKDEDKTINIEIDNEEDEAFINRIHRLSMRKVEIGRMRSKLINTSLSKDKYVDEVSIDKERAVKMADNIFKRRLKFINKNKENHKDNSINTSDNFQFSPQPFIKRLISRIDTESNDFNSQIQEKKEEIIGSADDYRNNVVKTEHNIESYDSKNNNSIQKDTNAKEFKVNTNKKTLSKGNLNTKSYTNIRSNNMTISTRGIRNNNQDLIQNANQNDNKKKVENKDIKEKRLNRNNNRVMSHTNIFEANRANPQIVNSPRANEMNTSRRRPANITTEIKIPNISSSISPRNANNLKLNLVTNVTRTNANQVPNTTRGNRGNNASKISPIPLPLDKMNKQLGNNQRGNNTSRGNNRSYISKPLEIEIKNNNNNRRNQNKVESKIIQINNNKTLTNEPRRRNVNSQINAKQTGILQVKTEMKNYLNTSRGNERNKDGIKSPVAKNLRGNERNKVEIKSPVAKNLRGNGRNKVEIKSPVAKTSRGNERNKVEIRSPVAKTSRGNERNKVEIKNQTTYNRRGNNQTSVKSPGKVENKKFITTTTSGRRGRK